MAANGSLINSLRYFEVVARYSSITKAAAELDVTPSAVSHHLRLLAEKMGEQLLTRSGRGVALTETGRRLAARLTSAFADVENSINEAVGIEAPVLRLAVCSSFGPGWIIGRMGDFLARHPAIQLQLLLYAKPPELTDAVGDAFVTTTREQPGFSSNHLFREVLVAVLAPRQGQDRSGDHLGLPLITTDLEPGQSGLEWKEYCEHTGYAPDAIGTGSWLMCSHYIFALEMAKQGLGIALVPEFLAQRDIQSGSLILFDAARMPSGRDYYLCIKRTRMEETALRSLSGWFADQFNQRHG